MNYASTRKASCLQQYSLVILSLFLRLYQSSGISSDYTKKWLLKSGDFISQLIFCVLSKSKMDKISGKYQVRALVLIEKFQELKTQHCIISRIYLFFSLYIFSGYIFAWFHKDKIARFTKPAVVIRKYLNDYASVLKIASHPRTLLAPIFVQISRKVSRPIRIYLGSIDAARWRYFRNSVSADNIWYDWPTDFLRDHDPVHSARSFEEERSF